MKKNILLITLGILLGGATMYAKDFKTQTVAAVPENIALEESFLAFTKAINEAGQFVQGHRWYESPREQAEAYQHILRALIATLEKEALSDPDFPFFHEVNPYTKLGMDNSDQRYLTAYLTGEGEYRVWGDRGTSRRLDFTLYKEGSSMAPSFATLTSDQLVTDENGNFELFIGGESRGENWLPGDTGRVRLLIRQIHSDWTNEIPGQIHIDRVDSGRPTYPLLTREKMADRLRATTNSFADEVRRWPELSRTRFAMLMPANSLTPPQDTGSEGGLSGRWMVGGHFNLAPDEALIITTRPTEAAYQGIQLGHHWWESIDYANRQASLTLDQVRVSSDGVIYFVISEQDPGVPNWLDTGGFDRGVILMRFDGMPSELSKEQKPGAQLVKLEDLHQFMPADEPQILEEERSKAIAARRAHVQRRYGF